MDKQKEIKEFLAFIVQEAKSKGKDPNTYVKELGEDGMKEAYKRYLAKKEQSKKEEIKKALHGAKLNYFKSLKHQCADDEEVVYYKKGGPVGCGCKKKEDRGEIKKSQSGWKVKFQNRDSVLADSNKDKIYDPKTKQFRPKTKEDEKKWKKNLKDAKEGKGEGTPPNINKGINKNACGGSALKMKNHLPPKKVNEEKCGGIVAKFKKHRLGGSLKSIPFMLQGTFKGGVLYRFRRSTNDMNNGYKTYSDLIMMTLDPLGHPTYDTPPISAGRTIYVTPLGNDTIFYTNNDYIFNKTPKGDLNLKKAKLKFYQLIKKSPIEGEEYRMTPYWNSNHINLDIVRNRALKGN